MWSIGGTEEQNLGSVKMEIKTKALQTVLENLKHKHTYSALMFLTVIYRHYAAWPLTIPQDLFWMSYSP